MSTRIPSSAGCVPSRKTGPGAVLDTTPPEKTAASRSNPNGLPESESA